MLAQVSTAIAGQKLQIVGVNASMNKKDETTEISITVEIKSTSELDDLIRKLSSLQGVIDVRR